MESQASLTKPSFSSFPAKICTDSMRGSQHSGSRFRRDTIKMGLSSVVRLVGGMQFDLESYAVLWSPSQNTFHIETIRRMLDVNRRAFNSKSKADYIVMEIADSYEEAGKACSKLKSKREEPKYC